MDVTFGVANQWGVAGSTAAWGPAVAERIEVAGEVGHHARTHVGFELLHARPELVDAGALVPGTGLAASAVSGWRDELSLLFAVRVPVDVGVAAPALRPVLRVLPTFGLAGGVFLTDAHVAVASFGGGPPLRSRATTPLFAARVGAELRLYEWLSLVPQGEFTLTFAGNRREQTGGETWDAEGRVLVGLDGIVRF